MGAELIRVLAIDGGGIRGYLPALVLAELERRARRPAIELFDLVVGTSTGGIIGIGLASGLSAQDLADFYPKYGFRIFGGSQEPALKMRLLGRGNSFWDRMQNSAQTVGAPFSGRPRFAGNARHFPQGLEEVLQETFGDQMLSEAAVDLAVVSFDGLTSTPVVFSRRDARADSSYDLPLRVVARATSAAPTFFPPCSVTWAGELRSFVDGGVWANNPAAVALAESISMTAAAGLTGTSVVMVSLGTGIAPSKESFAGTSDWIGTVGNLAASATSTLAGGVLAQRGLPSANFHRLEVVDDRVAGPMNDPAPERLAILRSAAERLISEQSAIFDRIIASCTRR